MKFSRRSFLAFPNITCSIEEVLFDEILGVCGENETSTKVDKLMKITTLMLEQMDPNQVEVIFFELGWEKVEDLNETDEDDMRKDEEMDPLTRAEAPARFWSNPLE